MKSSIISGGDAEAADFGLAEITQEQQLGPRGRVEAEHGVLWLRPDQTLPRR